MDLEDYLRNSPDMRDRLRDTLFLGFPGRYGDDGGEDGDYADISMSARAAVDEDAVAGEGEATVDVSYTADIRAPRPGEIYQAFVDSDAVRVSLNRRHPDRTTAEVVDRYVSDGIDLETVTDHSDVDALLAEKGWEIEPDTGTRRTPWRSRRNYLLEMPELQELDPDPLQIDEPGSYRVDIELVTEDDGDWELYDAARGSSEWLSVPEADPNFPDEDEVSLWSSDDELVAGRRVKEDSVVDRLLPESLKVEEADPEYGINIPDEYWDYFRENGLTDSLGLRLTVAAPTKTVYNEEDEVDWDRTRFNYDDPYTYVVPREEIAPGEYEIIGEPGEDGVVTLGGFGQETITEPGPYNAQVELTLGGRSVAASMNEEVEDYNWWPVMDGVATLFGNEDGISRPENTWEAIRQAWRGITSTPNTDEEGNPKRVRDGVRKRARTAKDESVNEAVTESLAPRFLADLAYTALENR